MQEAQEGAKNTKKNADGRKSVQKVIKVRKRVMNWRGGLRKWSQRVPNPAVTGCSINIMRKEPSGSISLAAHTMCCTTTQT